MVISTRHHMIGNSFETDLSVAPLLSTSKLYSKNQSEVVYTLSISYISKRYEEDEEAKALTKKFYRVSP